MFSNEIYVVIQTPNIPEGPYVIRKVTGYSTALRVTGNELECWEADLVELEDFMLGLQPNISERVRSRRN